MVAAFSPPQWVGGEARRCCVRGCGGSRGRGHNGPVCGAGGWTFTCTSYSMDVDGGVVRRSVRSFGCIASSQNGFAGSLPTESIHPPLTLFSHARTGSCPCCAGRGLPACCLRLHRRDIGRDWLAGLTLERAVSRAGTVVSSVFLFFLVVLTQMIQSFRRGWGRRKKHPPCFSGHRQGDGKVLRTPRGQKPNEPWPWAGV